MGKLFDGTEFFKMMADNEKTVAALYRQVAADARLGGKFLENLAKDEDRHFDIYTSLLKKHSGGSGLKAEISDDQERYMNLLIANNMLKDVDKLMKKAANFADKDQVYELAELAERDSVLYVEELMAVFPEVMPADFAKVLKEEKDHLKQVLSRRMENKMTSLRL